MNKRSVLNRGALAVSAVSFAAMGWIHILSARRLNASDGTGDMIAAVTSASEMIVARYGMAIAAALFIVFWFVGRSVRSVVNKVFLAASAAGFAYFAIGATVDLGFSRLGMAACVIVFLLSWFLGRPRRPAA